MSLFTVYVCICIAFGPVLLTKAKGGGYTQHKFEAFLVGKGDKTHSDSGDEKDRQEKNGSSERKWKAVHKDICTQHKASF